MAADRSRLNLFLLVGSSTVATVLFSVIVAFVKAPVDSPLASYDASEMLTILTITLAFLTGIVTLSLQTVFESLQWRQPTSQNRSLSSVATTVSSSIAQLGNLRKRSRLSNGGNKMKYIILAMPILLTLMNWLASVLLFLQTNIVVAYRHAFTYEVTAGVGQFNGSMVASYIQQLQDAQPGYTLKVMPYTTQALVYNLVTNPVHSVSQTPIGCEKDGQCYSYFLTGGLYLTTPWQPTNLTSSPVTEVENVMGRQIDFEVGTRGGQEFANNDCSTYSDDTTIVAMRLCVAPDRTSNASFVAGLFVCTEGAEDAQCSTANNSTLPSIRATITLHSRTGTLVVSRTNSSILSVSNLGTPIAESPPDMVGYRQALDWLLDFRSASIPGPSSIAAMFWNGQEQLSGQRYWDSEPSTAFQSILSYPLWMFHDNNFGNVDLSAHDILPDLPSEFYTRAALAQPLSRIEIGNAEFGAFAVFEGAVLLFLWMAAGWIYYRGPVAVPAVTNNGKSGIDEDEEYLR